MVQLKEMMFESKIQNILKETKLDFRIDTQPMTVEYKDQIITTDYTGLINSRTNKVLHAVKPGYRVSQNHELIRMALKGTEEFGNLKVHKGGPLNGGKKVYIQLAIQGDAKVANDTLKRYITILDSNDGTTAISFGYGNFTMSCSNEFSRFLRERDFKIFHNSELEEKLKQVPQILYHCLEADYRLMEIYRELEATPLHKELVNTMVKHLIGVDRTMTAEEIKYLDIRPRKLNIMNSLYDNIDKEIRGKGFNLWALQSGVTSFTTHDKSVPRRPLGREESALIGSASVMNNKSLELVMKTAELVW